MSGARREPEVAANGDGAAAAPEPKGDENGDEKAKAETTKLFVNRGERSGIDEEDLRWALREGAVLPEEAIHDVRVLHRFSFVEVDPEHGRADRRVPRRHQAQGQRDPPRDRQELDRFHPFPRYSQEKGGNDQAVSSAIISSSRSKSIGLVM